MASKNLTNLRNLLANRAPLLAADGSNSSRGIIEKFRNESPEIIARCRSELEDIALLKILDDVSRRRICVKHDPAQQDFLGTLGLPIMLSLSKVDGSSTRKPLGKLRISEAETWLINSQRSRRRKMRDHKKLRNLVAAVKPYVTSPDMTLDEAIAVAVRAGAELIA